MATNGSDGLEPAQDAPDDAIPLVSYYEHERHRREVIRNVAVFLAFCMAVAAAGVGLLAYWQQAL
ncbi:MAG TPA: hypothetical protein VGU45_09220 [Microvirga sp.]|nr:hypothetical protein [Microvirga sp.]